MAVHEFSGTLTYETRLGVESFEFAYNLITNPAADEDQLENAAKAIAHFLFQEYLDSDPPSSVYNSN